MLTVFVSSPLSETLKKADFFLSEAKYKNDSYMEGN